MSTLLTAVRSPFPAPATLDDTGIAIDPFAPLTGR